jgi:hypothetical protein
VQRLFNEHDEILRRIEGIDAKIRACLDGPVAEILSEVAALRSTLQSHEERETAMLEDAMYHDTGFAG